MKTTKLLLITLFLLMANANIYGQYGSSHITQEQYEAAIKQKTELEKELKKEQDKQKELKKELDKQSKKNNEINEIINNGVTKQKNNIDSSVPEDGAIYDVNINNKKLQHTNDSQDASPETLMKASEMEVSDSKNGLQEGTDYIKMNNGNIALKTEKAFASTINMYNDAINDYNKSLEKYRNIENEYNNIAETYIKMPSGAEKEIKKGELEKKNDEMIAIKNKVKNHYNEALKHEETITRSITNNDLKNKASKAIDLEKLRRDTKYLRDNYFKECTGCGKQ